MCGKVAYGEMVCFVHLLYDHKPKQSMLGKGVKSNRKFGSEMEQ